MADEGWIFVYGLLKRGFRLAKHPVLEAARQEIRAARVRGELYDLGEYPGLRRGEGWVEGEVHRFSRIGEILKLMDEMEGYHPQAPEKGLYVREMVKANFDSGEACRAWTYYYRGFTDGARRLPGGRWPAGSPAS